MNAIMNLVKSLKVSQKLAIVAGVLMVPIVVLTYLYLSTVGKLNTFVKKEIAGVEYLQYMSKLHQLVPQHRGMMNAQLNGDKAYEDRITNVVKEMDEAIKSIDAVNTKHGVSLVTNEKWKGVRDQWLELRGNAGSLSAADSFAKHNELMAKILDLSNQIGDQSNLIYDPVNVSYALQDNVVYRIPTLTDFMGASRGFSSGLIAKKSITQEDRNKIAEYRGKIEASRDLVKTNVNLINEKADAATKAKVEAAYKQSEELTDKYIAFLDKNFLEAKDITVTNKELWDVATKAIDSYVGANGAFDATIPALATVLTERQRGYSQAEYIALVSIAAGVILALGLVYVVSQNISQQANTLQRTFSMIGVGDFSARAETFSQDELGQVSLSLNAMLDNTVALIQSQEEKDAIQASIMKLLDEVSGVGDGDLTKEAEVTADVMGAVADSFNYMIAQLRDIIGNVQKSTRLVTGTANEIVSNTRQIASGSETQATQIITTSSAVEQMAISAKQVSENAAISATVAQQALLSAKAGNEAVKNTIAGMDRIRDQVQETAKRIKRLGESSQEIGQIIQLIEDIADRTSILALNASIQAAMAGDAGRGFAVVAEEVERLADRSTDATKKIGSLVKSIQSETSEAVTAMEKGIQEVVDGSRLASQAGNSLGEIESVSNKLADLIQSISASSRQQATASEGVTRAMADISEITRDTAEGTKQAAGAVSNLARLAQELRNSVAQFKIPGGESSSGSSLPNGESTNGWHDTTEKTASRF